MRRLLLLLLRGYQVGISPLKPQTCRFYPTCSNYACEAVAEHGAFKGSLLAAWRLLRCNPLFKGGVDPVPPKKVAPAAHPAEGGPPR
ncbi:MAG: membrane protein insertion efficiency factor YidD [Oceanidesulfovibrio sp.]